MKPQTRFYVPNFKNKEKPFRHTCDIYPFFQNKFTPPDFLSILRTFTKLAKPNLFSTVLDSS